MMRWYVSLAAGVLPILVLGFLTSGYANRLAFIAWALGWATAYAALLVLGWRGRWRRSVLVGVMLVLVGAAWGSWGALVAVHRETFDLGLRAFLPFGYRPLWSDPRLGYGVGGALAVVGLLLVLLSTPISARRRPRERQ